MSDGLSDDLWTSLTKQERIVACQLAAGKTTREIAKGLELSVKTIDAHRAHILDKLPVHNTTQLAHLALSRRWIENIYG